MAKQFTKENPFVGRWRIVSMSAWEDDCLDEEVQAFIAFDAGGRGSLHFGCVQGQFAYRTKNGMESVRFNSPGTEKTVQTVCRWKVLGGHRAISRCVPALVA